MTTSVDNTETEQEPLLLMDAFRASDGGLRLEMCTYSELLDVRARIQHELSVGGMNAVTFASIRELARGMRDHIVLAFQAMLKGKVPPDVVDFQHGSALEEAIQNAARDGNQYDPAKRVSVQFGALEDSPHPSAALMVQDEGPGFVLEDVPNCNHPDYIERPNGRGLLMMNMYFQRHNGRGRYFPMTPGSCRTNTLLLEFAIEGLGIDEIRSRFRAWMQNNQVATDTEPSNA